MRYSTKNFLSDSPDESGSIICKITSPRASELRQYTVDQGGYLTASVRLADCADHIFLDFNAEGPKAYEKRVMKLDKLIEDLQAMRHQYVAMWENHQRDLKWYNEKNKEDKK